jgi:hypothetical protein
MLATTIEIIRSALKGELNFRGHNKSKIIASAISIAIAEVYRPKTFGESLMMREDSVSQPIPILPAPPGWRRPAAGRQ